MLEFSAMAKRRAPDATVVARKRTPPMTTRPWYYDAGMKFGLPAVAAGFLLYFTTQVVNTKLDAAVDLQRQHQAEMSKELGAVVKLLGEQNDQQRQMLTQQWVQIGVLQRTCLNTSKTDADRIACAAMTPPPSQPRTP